MARMRAKYGKDEKGRKYLKYYYAEFYDAHRHPRQKRISLHTRDRDAARLALADMERRFLAGLFDPWEDKPQREGTTVREAVAMFLKNWEERCVPNTVATYRTILETFAEPLAPGILLYVVEQRHVTAFLDKGKRTDATRNSYTNQLRIFFAWCREESLMKSDPMPPAVRGKRRRLKKLPQFLSEDEYETLIRTIEADGLLKKEMADNGRGLIDAIRFAVGTGLRRGELCNLRWSAIDLNAGMITVKNTEDFLTKSGRERPVPLVGEAREVIERRAAERASEADEYVFKGARGGKLNGNYFGKRFRQYRRMARLPESINVHSLRSPRGWSSGAWTSTGSKRSWAMPT